MAHQNITRKAYISEPVEGKQNMKTVKNFLTEKFPNMKDFPNAHRISIFERGSLIGAIDAYNDGQHSSTLRCISQKGKLLVMTKECFLKLRKINNTWSEII